MTLKEWLLNEVSIVVASAAHKARCKDLANATDPDTYSKRQLKLDKSHDLVLSLFKRKAKQAIASNGKAKL